MHRINHYHGVNVLNPWALPERSPLLNPSGIRFEITFLCISPLFHMTDEPYAAAKITEKMQITLPMKVIEKIGKPEKDDYLLFFEKDGDLVIRRGKKKIAWIFPEA